MVMTAEVLPPEVLLNAIAVQDLPVAQVVHYLQNNHWTAINHPNPRLLVFEKGVDDQGKPIQIVLPSQDTYEDKPHLLIKVINLLAVLKSMSFQEIILAIEAEMMIGS
jgi:hypothetical protein